MCFTGRCIYEQRDSRSGECNWFGHSYPVDGYCRLEDEVNQHTFDECCRLCAGTGIIRALGYDIMCSCGIELE